MRAFQRERLILATSVTPRGMLSLPCPPEDSACGSGNVPFSSPLSQGASADEVLDASQTILESIGMVPGLEVADATSALISLFREDYTGAALSAGAILPVGGQAFTGIKWARRAGRVADAVHGNSKLSEKAQHGYVIYDTIKKEIVKVGVSGGEVSKSGKSFRANRQLAELNKSNPGQYKARIVKTIPAGPGSRSEILGWEKVAAEKLRGKGRLTDRTLHQRP